MFDYIFGKVEYINEDSIVIDVGGIGYKIHTSMNTISHMKQDSNMRIYTQLIIREDDASIYGFGTREELSLFKLLLSVSGVGPKAALSLLSTSKASELSSAIISNDTKRLTMAQGIGKKTAEMIILKLKDKISVEDILASPMGMNNQIEVTEVIEALVALGYQYPVASNAVNALPDKSKKTPALIKDALKLLASK